MNCGDRRERPDPGTDSGVAGAAAGPRHRALAHRPRFRDADGVLPAQRPAGGCDRGEFLGQTIIVEIKSSVADYRADQKWTEYLEFCDVFYFAVPLDFPREILPEDCGLMVADDYGAEIIREAPAQAMNGSRRRAQTLRLALTAMQRLGRMNDPDGFL